MQRQIQANPVSRCLSEELSGPEQIALSGKRMVQRYLIAKCLPSGGGGILLLTLLFQIGNTIVKSVLRCTHDQLRIPAPRGLPLVEVERAQKVA